MAGPLSSMRFEHPHGTGPLRRPPAGAAVSIYDQGSPNRSRLARCVNQSCSGDDPMEAMKQDRDLQRHRSLP